MTSAVEKIRALMVERGWNPTDLSRELEAVSDRFSESWRVTVERWLTKETPPTASHADALAAVFGVPASEFLPADATQADWDRVTAALVEAEVERAALLRQLADRSASLRQHPEQPKHGSRTRKG